MGPVPASMKKTLKGFLNGPGSSSKCNKPGSGRGSSCIENNGIRGVPVKGGGTHPKTHALGNGQNLQIVKDLEIKINWQRPKKKKKRKSDNVNGTSPSFNEKNLKGFPQWTRFQLQWKKTLKGFLNGPQKEQKNAQWDSHWNCEKREFWDWFQIQSYPLWMIYFYILRKYEIWASKCNKPGISVFLISKVQNFLKID